MADIARLGIKIDSRGVVRAIKEVNRLTKSGKELEATFTAVKNIAGTVFAGAAIRGLVAYSDEWNNLQNRLRVFTKTEKELDAVTKQLLRTSIDTRTELRGTVELYSRLALNTDKLNLSQEQTIRLTKIVGKAIAASGATATEATGAIIQFGQGLGTNFKSAGQEINSLNEQVPYLAKTIAKGIGDGTKNLKELAKEGALTSKAVLKSLFEQEKGIEAFFAKTNSSVSQATTQIFDTIGEAFGPERQKLVDSLVDSLNGVRDFFDDPKNIQGIRDVASSIGVLGEVITPLVSGLLLSKLAKGFVSVSETAYLMGLEMKTAAGATNYLNKALSFIGGPTGAVFALATGIAILSTRESALDKITKKHADTIDGLSRKYANAADNSDELNRSLELRERITARSRIKELTEEQSKVLASFTDITRDTSSGITGMNVAFYHTKQAYGDLIKQVDSGNISWEKFGELVSDRMLSDDIDSGGERLLKISDAMRALNKEIEDNRKIVEGRKDPKPVNLSIGANIPDDSLLARVGVIKESLKLEREIESESYTQRINDLIAFRDAKKENAIEANRLIEQEQQRHQDRLDEINKTGIDVRYKYLTETQQDTLGAVGQVFGNMATLMRQGGKDAFEAYKVFAIAQAGVSGAMAVIQALAAPAPPPIPQILAGTTAALVATQVAMITQQSYSGRALGGQAQAGTSYIVGERGPELLTMGNKSGNITPNNKLGTGGDVNVTQVFQISPGIEGAVQAEVMRMAPVIAAQAQAGVESAIYRGGSMTRAVGRRR